MNMQTPHALRFKIRGLERILRRDEPRLDVSRRRLLSLHRRYHTLYRKFKEAHRP